MDDKEFEKLKHERDEYLDGWKRAKADFLNYKKEESMRMQIMTEYTERDLLIKILPILDGVERAMKEIPEKQRKGEVYKGFLQIVSLWQKFLKNQGIEEIEAIGKQFDPEVHEAVEEVEGEESGVVVEEAEKGYMKNKRVLRVAKVKVTK